MSHIIFPYAKSVDVKGLNFSSSAFWYNHTNNILFTHTEGNMTQHIYSNTEHNAPNIRESFLGGGRQCLAQMNDRGHARSRRVLQLTNGGDRKVSTSSRAVAVRMAVKGAL